MPVAAAWRTQGNGYLCRCGAPRRVGEGVSVSDLMMEGYFAGAILLVTGASGVSAASESAAVLLQEPSLPPLLVRLGPCRRQQRT
jgi:hypothetical protein